MAQNNETLIPKKAIDSVNETNTAIVKLDESTFKFISTVEKLNEELKKGNITFDKVASAQKKTETNTKKLTEIEKQQIAAEKALEKQRQRGLAQLAKQEAKEREYQNALNLTVKSEQDLITKTNALVKQRKLLDQTTDSGRKKHAQLTAEIKKNTDQLKAQDLQIGRSQRNVGNYQSALGGLGNAAGLLSPRLASATNGVKAFGSSLLKLLANPIVAIVAGITAAFAALVAVFKSTDDGGTKLEALFQSIGSVLDVLKRRSLNLIDAFKALFSGDFQEAGELFRESVQGIGDDIRETTQATWDYVYALDALNDRRIAFISEEAKARKEIEKNVQLSKDQTRTDQERLNFLQKAIDLELGLANKKREFAQEEFNAELMKQAASAATSEEILRNFVSLNEAEQTALRAGNSEIARIWNVLGDDVVKTLEEQYAAIDIADADYFRRSQRLAAQLSGFKKSLNQENLDDTKETSSKIEEIEAQATENAINNIKAIAEAKFDEGQDIDSVLSDLDTELQAELDAIDQEINAWKEKYDYQEKREKELKDLRTQLAIQSANAVFDIYSSTIDRQLQQSEKQRDYELELAGDSREEQEKINEKYDKKEAELKAKKAKADKAQALFTAAINTTLAILSSLKDYPLPAGLPFLLLNAAFGAVQIATIAAKPIPQFYKGTESAPSGLLSVAEKGQELVETRDGKKMLFKKPTITSGLEGAKIHTNKETEAILRGERGQRIDISELSEKQDITNKYLRNLGVYNGKGIEYPNKSKLKNYDRMK